MDIAGNPIESDLPYELTSDGALDPTDLAGVFLLGMMTYQADAAVFEECLSGVRYPIAQEGDYLALERAYLDARSGPGAPLLVHVTGGLASRPTMEGPDRTTLVVEGFNRVIPGESCQQHQSTASLTDTYWRIDTLMGEAVGPVAGRREPHLVLMSAPEARFRATVGCNQLVGGYERDGDRLSFGAGASTMMACPPPLDAGERALRAVLETARSYRQTGQKLVLHDDDGQPIAELSAVYLY
jgi:heat shock protein HslJ